MTKKPTLLLINPTKDKTNDALQHVEMPSKFTSRGIFRSETLSTHKHLKHETSHITHSQEHVGE